MILTGFYGLLYTIHSFVLSFTKRSVSQTYRKQIKHFRGSSVFPFYNDTTYPRTQDLQSTHCQAESWSLIYEEKMFWHETVSPCVFSSVQTKALYSKMVCLRRKQNLVWIRLAWAWFAGGEKSPSIISYVLELTERHGPTAQWVKALVLVRDSGGVGSILTCGNFFFVYFPFFFFLLYLTRLNLFLICIKIMQFFKISIFIAQLNILNSYCHLIFFEQWSTPINHLKIELNVIWWIQTQRLKIT